MILKIANLILRLGSRSYPIKMRSKRFPIKRAEVQTYFCTDFESMESIKCTLNVSHELCDHRNDHPVDENNKKKLQRDGMVTTNTWSWKM